MQVFVNFPNSEDGIKQLLDNLATFKAELMIKGIDMINIKEETKEMVLEKVLEILDSKKDVI